MSTHFRAGRACIYIPRGGTGGARPAYAAQAGDTTSGSSITVPVPAGLTGDLLLAFATTGGSSSGSDASAISPPAGWTLVTGSSSGASALYYRIYDGTEPSSYTWNVGSHTGVFVVNTVRIIGANATAPIVSFTKATTSNLQATSLTAASQTVTANNELLVALLNIHASSAVTVTQPSGATLQYNVLTPTVGRTVAGGTTPEDSSTSSTTGTQTWGTSANVQWRLACVLIKP